MRDGGRPDAGGGGPALSKRFTAQLKTPGPLLAGDHAQLWLSGEVLGAPSDRTRRVRHRWSIRDARGEQVRELRGETVNGPNLASRFAIVWDGLDGAGEPVQSGRYSLVAELDVVVGAEPAELVRTKKASLEVVPATVESAPKCLLLGKGAHNPATLQPELSIYGTDMGLPVVIGERLYLLFGDTWTRAVCEGTDEPYVSLTSDDVLGSLALEPAPDPERCLEIEFPVLPEEPSKFAPMTLDHVGERIELLALGVASTAFQYEQRLFAIFNPYGPVVCRNDAACAEGAFCDPNALICGYKMQPALPRRIIAVSEETDGRPNGRFNGIAELNVLHFSNLTARPVNAIDDAGGAHDYGNDRPRELLVFGRANWLAGLEDDGELVPHDLFLFRQPLADLVAKGRFEPRYFSGMGDDGKPRWSEESTDAVPVVPGKSELAGQSALPPTPIYYTSNMHVSAIPEFGREKFRWLLTYGGRAPKPIDFIGSYNDSRIGIFFRMARDPWGPWTAPRRLWSVYSPEGPSLVYRPEMDDSVASDEGRGPRSCDVELPYEDAGVEYSPEVLELFSKVDGNRLTLHWLMSVWNPYRTVQMKSEIVAE